MFPNILALVDFPTVAEITARGQKRKPRTRAWYQAINQIRTLQERAYHNYIAIRLEHDQDLDPTLLRTDFLTEMSEVAQMVNQLLGRYGANKADGADPLNPSAYLAFHVVIGSSPDRKGAAPSQLAHYLSPPIYDITSVLRKLVAIDPKTTKPDFSILGLLGEVITKQGRRPMPNKALKHLGAKPSL